MEAIAETEIALKLLAHCRAFIAKQDITCVETVYQSDRVILGAYEFIEGICEIAGYAPTDDEDED
jgi:hypothetical protein